MSLLADDIGAGKIAAAVAGGATRAESVASGARVPARRARTSCSCTTPPGRWSTPALVDRVLRGLAAGRRRRRAGARRSPTRSSGRAGRRGVGDARPRVAACRADAAGLPASSGCGAAIERAGATLAAATDCASLVEARRRPGGLRRGRPAQPQGDDAGRPGAPGAGAGRVIVDYHLHLRPDDEPARRGARSRPSTSREYVETARARGVDEIAITEHVYRFAAGAPTCPTTSTGASTRCDDIDRYCAALAAAARRRPAGARSASSSTGWPGPRADARGDRRRLRVGRRARLGALVGPLAFDHPDYPIWDAAAVDDVWRRLRRRRLRRGRERHLRRDGASRPGQGVRPAARRRPCADELGDRLAECFRGGRRLRRDLDRRPAQGGRRDLPAPTPGCAGCTRPACRSRWPPTRTCPADVGLDFDRCLAAASAAGYTSLVALPRARAAGGRRLADLRVGTAFDAHRLVAGRPLVLGGVDDSVSRRGLDGHSDADIVCHVLVRRRARRGRAGRHRPALPGHAGVARRRVASTCCARAFAQRRGRRLAARATPTAWWCCRSRRSRRTSTRCATAWPSRCARRPTASRSAAPPPTASASRAAARARPPGGRAARALAG